MRRQAGLDLDLRARRGRRAGPRAPRHDARSRGASSTSELREVGVRRHWRRIESMPVAVEQIRRAVPRNGPNVRYCAFTWRPVERAGRPGPRTGRWQRRAANVPTSAAGTAVGLVEGCGDELDVVADAGGRAAPRPRAASTTWMRLRLRPTRTGHAPCDERRVIGEAVEVADDRLVAVDAARAVRASASVPALRQSRTIDAAEASEERLQLRLDLPVELDGVRGRRIQGRRRWSCRAARRRAPAAGRPPRRPTGR